MLFNLTQNDVFEDNPTLRAIPQFDCLTDRQMRYVILTCDYDSPLKKLSAEKKRTQAALMAGYKYEKNSNKLDMNARNIINGKVESVVEAEKTYLQMQYDQDREMLLLIEDQIEQIMEFIRKKGKSANELEKSIKMSEKLPELYQVKKKLAEILNIRDHESQQETDVINSSQLSTLELLNTQNS